MYWNLMFMAAQNKRCVLFHMCSLLGGLPKPCLDPPEGCVQLGGKASADVPVLLQRKIFKAFCGATSPVWQRNPLK